MAKWPNFTRVGNEDGICVQNMSEFGISAILSLPTDKLPDRSRLIF